MLITKHDIAAIEAAIARAEARSAGELVVAVLRHSDAYVLPRAVCTGAWTVAATLALGIYGPQWPTAWLILSQIPMAAMVWIFLGWPPVLRLLLGRRQTAARVRARAMQVFVERGVHATRDQSGLLILISELEHQVVILGDRGIHTHVGTDGWERHVARLTEGIRARRLTTALLSVIDEFASILAEKFPARPDDVNELPNHVILQ